MIPVHLSEKYYNQKGLRFGFSSIMLSFTYFSDSVHFVCLGHLTYTLGKDRTLGLSMSLRLNKEDVRVPTFTFGSL